MSSRMKAILGAVITVFFLTGVFFVGWSLSSSKKSTTTPASITLSPAQQAQSYYQQGIAALSTDQTGTAAELFKKAVILDPSNTAAKAALASATAPPPAPAPTPAPAKPKPKAADPFLKPVSDIAALLPKSFSGYSLGVREKLGADASVTGNANAVTAPATNIVWSVHDRKTASAANSFVTKTSKSLYGKDGAAVTISGYTGYFGTDGTHFASVSVARGRYVFEVTLTSANGAPASLKAIALQAAGAFPAAP